jgi:general secretion pathway protein F
MAVFSYIALDKDGVKRKGVIEADSERNSRQVLREQQLSVVSVKEVNAAKGKDGLCKTSLRKLASRDVSVTMRQLATLIQSGLSVELALYTISMQSESQNVRAFLATLRNRVKEGYSLAESIAASPGILPDLFEGSINAGERTGHLGLVLEHLADYAERTHQARQKIVLALLYPGILVSVSFIITIFLMTYIVPDMIKIFSDTGHSLPLLTMLLIKLTHATQDYGVYVLIALVAGALFIKARLKQPANRKKYEIFLLRLPLIGPLIKQYNATQFASTLGMLQESGVSLLKSLEIAGNVIRNLHVKSNIQTVWQNVSEGKSLSSSLGKSGLFPPMLVTMVGSGEATGKLGFMLSRASIAMQRELEGRVAILLGLFEPLLLLCMGIMVLLLVLAIIMPIINLNQMVN